MRPSSLHDGWAARREYVNGRLPRDLSAHDDGSGDVQYDPGPSDRAYGDGDVPRPLIHEHFLTQAG